MIDINFLNGGEIAGLEYLHFQKDRGFYLELTKVISDNLSEASLAKSAAKEIEAVITKYSGFENITVELEKGCYSAYAHGTAFFSPTHVLRNKGIEDYLSVKESAAFKTLKKLEKDVLTGWVDYSTGKVCGDFTKIKCTITTDTELDSILPVPPKGLGYAEAFALIFIHEVGHFFNNCATIADVAGDDYVGKMAIACIAMEPDPIKKSAILNRSCDLIEVAVTSNEIAEAIETNDPVAIDMLLSTKMVQRDKKRTLSLGVTNISSEVLADAYAIRMGGGIDVAKMVDTFRQYNSSCNRVNAVTEVLLGLLKGLLLSTPAGAATVVTIKTGLKFMNLLTMLRYVLNFTNNNMTFDYNTPERRVTDVIKQVISLIREDKYLSTKDKLDAIKVIDELRKVPVADFLFNPTSVSPINTVVNRTLGFILSGGKWTKTEYVHYTSNIANHEVNLLEHKFNALLS